LSVIKGLLGPYWGRIVDVHAHVGPDQRFLLRCSASDLVEAYDRCGIRVGLVSSTISLLADYAVGNRLVLEAVKRYPERIVGLYSLNPLYEEAVEELRAYVEIYGFRGVKLHPDYFYIEPSEEPAVGALEAVAKLGVPLMLHSYDGGVEASKVAELFPEMTIVVYHMGGVSWREGLRRLRRYDNVYVEISSSVTERGLVEEAVRTLGSSRVLFGSDIPYLEPAVSLGKVLGARIGRDEVEDILYRNAERLGLVRA